MLHHGGEHAKSMGIPKIRLQTLMKHDNCTLAKN